ncbi:hypothetical protein P153DRAFT_278803 [Dothidotthia symphoricarpi CBS 119687]|uniref:Uncharacterized protein n=1 Tax=Dothidotthia symphoricarpi CBS 119687 TaxID=1392245 RepID=A0A6A6ATK3_9PLEO|nr:uncharacterized protein P153DRAFT_278803 [Dothidotthia symphoricarpi CBS 119687]KAF2134518.1 hypothetical protein P153DRAFT_278803 [Dothidotthia symphoricarpi CBS 119687]
MTSTATKVTSSGSQFSVSDVPTVPNPTPFSEGVPTGCHSPFDHVALVNQLADNQDQLNEAANEAMYPSPPINTPEVLSPVPSIVQRIQTRGRGISFGLGDRLAQVKIEGRKLHHGTDVTSSSRSLDQSLAEEEDDCDCCTSEAMSEDGEDKVGPGRGSSPMMNPRIEEYLSFSAASMPDRGTSTAVNADVVSTSDKTVKDSDNAKTANGSNINKILNVAERTNWAEEVEEYVDGAFARLEQLANDEHVNDSSMNVEEYYIARLKRMLASAKRPIPVNIPGPTIPKNEEAVKNKEAVKEAVKKENTVKNEEAIEKGAVKKEAESEETKPEVI